MKCDETKPQCLKCQTSSRICDGYLPDHNFIPRRHLVAAVRNLSTIASASKALSRSPSPFRPDSDLFDVFRHHTAPATTSFLPSSFWNGSLLQLAHNEPAIWHATAAIGALHRRIELAAEQSDGSYNVDALTRRAEAHHGKALALGRDLDTEPKLMALALALMASSNLLGRLAESQVHVLAGLRAARQLDCDRSSDVATLTNMLARMDMQAMTFSDSQSPYPFADAIKLQESDHTARGPSHPLQSYEQATSSLFLLLRRSMLVDEGFSREDQGEQPYSTKLCRLLQDIRDWESSMSGFESRLCPESTRQTPGLSVRLYHTFLRLVIKATMFGLETRWDSCLAHYVRIVTLAQALAQRRCGNGKPWLSLELGLVVPLFFTAHRCRHAVIRRRAAALLQQLNSQEGMWGSMAAAAAARLIISVEEGREGHGLDEMMEEPTLSHLHQLNEAQNAADLQAVLAVPWEAWAAHDLELRGQEMWETSAPVAEGNRVKEILIVAQFDKRTAHMKLLMGSTDPNMPFGEAKDRILRY